MRVEEAKAIASIVCGLGVSEDSICLNVGSSTRYFREEKQPHIKRELIEPLENIGIKFIHCDLKPDDGVDLVGDVLDPQFQAKMKSVGAHILLCCNLLEHLKNRDEFAAACASCVRPGGYMVVSVPYSYPYHEDPIDTMFRPTPAELQHCFDGWELVFGDIIESTNYLHDLKNMDGGFRFFVRQFVGVMFPFYRPSHWLGKAHRMTWLFRPYKITLAVLRKPDGNE